MVKATEVTAGLAESNGSLLPGLWHDSLHVNCGLTACTPGSAPGPTLGNEYGKTLPYTCHMPKEAEPSLSDSGKLEDSQSYRHIITLPLHYHGSQKNEIYTSTKFSIIRSHIS